MKTAIEWLEEKLKESLGEDFDAVRGYFVMAKDVEQIQITNAFDKAEFHAADFYDPKNPNVDCAENYFNETYGGEK